MAGVPYPLSPVPLPFSLPPCPMPDSTPSPQANHKCLSHISSVFLIYTSMYMVVKFLFKTIQSSFATLTSMRCSLVLKKYASVPFIDLLALHLGHIIRAFSSLLLKFFAISKANRKTEITQIGICTRCILCCNFKNIHEEE